MQGVQDTEDINAELAADKCMFCPVSGEASPAYLFLFVWNLSVQYCQRAEHTQPGAENGICVVFA